MKKKLTIENLMSNPYSSANFFTYLPTYFENSALEQEIAYYVESKHRVCSHHVEDFVDENGKLTESDSEMLANVLKLMYKEKWDRMYAAITEVYDTLFNEFGTTRYTDMKTGGHSDELSFENRKDSETYDNYKELSKLDYGDGINVSNTYGERVEKQKYDNYEEMSGSKDETVTPSEGYKRVESSGFAGDNLDSFANQNRTEQTQEGSLTTSTNYNNTKTVHKSENEGDVRTINSYTDAQKTTGSLGGEKNVSGSKNNEKIGKEIQSFNYNDETLTHEETVKMNRGVNVTSQKLIEQELELRKFLFYDEMFKDINKFITLSIYF